MLAGAAVIAHEPVNSAGWEANLSGLLDLSDPAAAALADQKVPIVLPVHVLVHPSRGAWVVDTGIDADLAAGGRGPARGLLTLLAGGIEPRASLASIAARQPAPLSGVLVTHLHVDHVLGLADVAPDVPVYIGAGETHARKVSYAFTRRTYNATLRGHAPLQAWDFSGAPVIDGVPVIDVLGDGSLWALAVPGHTVGSTAFLANTTSGPMLFTGDCSHTLWGWEHGVIPGGFTEDPDGNRRSLAALKRLVAAHPEIRVWVGHELDGEGTGVP